MLFLAVFCGFLAEYQLEHIIENHKEKQYVESMIADMREDSAKTSSSVFYCNKQSTSKMSLLS